MTQRAGELPKEAEVLRPTSAADVQELVRTARREGWALYPISTGRNWGYGAPEQLSPGMKLLDLSGMRRIINSSQISLSNPVAVIEPGVTQGDLSAFLKQHQPGLTFNVTGSARETSLLGNCLDRGVGYLGPRRDDLFGLEVVTGTGEILRTGFRRLGEGSALAHCHPFGLGPMLDGLFFQGNFGVVTSACFRLLPRADAEVAVSLALRDVGRLAELIDALCDLKRRGVVGSVTHLANQARARASLEFGVSEYLRRHCGVAPAELPGEVGKALATVAPHEWTSLSGISGSTAHIKAALTEVRKAVKGLADVKVVDDRKLELGHKLLHPLRRFAWPRANAAAIAAIKPLHGLAVGEPTDAAVANLLWRFGAADLPASELDRTACGILFISAALPTHGESAVAAVADLTRRAAEFGFPLYVTVNIETGSSLVAVTNLLFDKRLEEEVARAQACARAMRADLRVRGLEVYRARTDMMRDIVDDTDPHWQQIWRLKQVFDPDNVIAPGRYNLAGPPSTWSSRWAH